MNLILSLIQSAQAWNGSFWMPEQASTHAADIDFLFDVVNWMNLLFFILLMGAMAYFVVAYREKSPDQKTSPVKGNHTLELAWSVIPGIMVFAVAFMGMSGWMDMNVPPAESMEIGVQGQKWNWSFTYPTDGDVSVTTGSEEGLIVPEGKPVKLVMNSVDVIHSFFIPAFRVKKDVVPNRYTVVWFEATKTGTFQVFCTEYCGTDHSRMLTEVHVKTQAEYDAWLQSKVDEKGALASASPEEQGKAKFSELGCNACHSVEGQRLVGPALNGKFGTMENLEGGEQVMVDENYVRESIMAPAAKIVEGYAPAMPPYQGRVTDEDVNNLIAYLKSIK